MALVLLSGAAMAQWTVVTVNGINNIPSEKVDLSAGLESGYYLLKQVNSNASAAGGQGVGWIKAASEAANAVVTSKNTGTPSTDGVTYVWYVEVVDATNNLITISTANKVAAWQAPDKYQKNLVAYDSRATLKYHTGTVNLSGNATPNEGSCFISNEGTTAFVHFSGDNLGSWTDTNSASMFMVEFYKLGDADLNKTETTYNNLTYTVTDETGKEYTGTYEGVAGTTVPEFTGAAGYTLTDAVWNDLNYSAKINFTYPVSNKENGITNETLLTINGTQKYICNVDGNVKVKENATDANSLWAIYPSFSNGAFTFAIMNVVTGKYIYTEATAAKLDNTDTNTYISNNAAAGTFVLNDTPTQFVIASDKDFKISDKNLYLSINSPTYDKDVYLGLYGNAHNGTNVTKVELPYYEVAVTEAKYATFFAPYAVTVPDDVTAHTVTLNGNWAVLSEPLSVIPAYTGVVLYSETAQTYTFNVTTTDVTVKNNALRGTVASEYVTANAYVLGIPEGETEVCFAKAVTEGQAAGTFLNNHHKAYLPAPAGSNIAAYSFRFGEGTTGIEEITDNREQSTVIYDLTGRRVEAITAPGIYVVNGKKVLVK